MHRQRGSRHQRHPRKASNHRPAISARDHRPGTIPRHDNSWTRTPRDPPSAVGLCRRQPLVGPSDRRGESVIDVGIRRPGRQDVGLHRAAASSPAPIAATNEPNHRGGQD